MDFGGISATPMLLKPTQGTQTGGGRAPAAQAPRDTRTSARCWLVPLSHCAVGAAGTGHCWEPLGPELGASAPHGLLCPQPPMAHGGWITPMSMRDQLSQFGFSGSWLDELVGSRFISSPSAWCLEDPCWVSPLWSAPSPVPSHAPLPSRTPCPCVCTPKTTATSRGDG